MELSSLIPLFGALFNFLVGLFVFSRAPGSPANRIYFGLSVCIATWNLGTYFMFAVDNAEAALFWARFLQYGVIFIPILLCHLSLIIGAFYAGAWRKVIPLAYLLGAGLAAGNLAGYFVSGVRDAGYAYYGIAGPLFVLFPLLFSLSFVSLLALARRRRQLPPLHQRRLLPLFAAQSMLCLLGFNDILPIIGIFRYPGTDFGIYPFGSLGAVFYGLIVGYSVLQHQLLNVQVVLSRLAAHAIRIFFLLALALVLLLLVASFAAHHFTPVAVLTSMGVFLISTIFGSVLFPRLFGQGETGIESLLLGDRFEYHVRIRAFAASMHQYSDTEALLQDLDELLLGLVGVEGYSIVLLDDTRRQFQVFRALPARPELDAVTETLSRRVFEFQSRTPGEGKFLGRVHAIDSVSDPVEKEVQLLLRSFEAELMLPFTFDEEPYGMMFLGRKTSGDPFTATDTSLLSVLAENLSLIMNQMRLKNQILQAQELDLLGRMSRGMAHDLNNLLTPVHTFLQLAQEGTSTENLQDLMPVALKNISTMRAYIREALFFSQNLRPDFQLGRLDVVLQSAIELVRDRAVRREVQILTTNSQEVRLEIDSVLIERLITNLLANAIDASVPGRSVSLHCSSLPSIDGQREWWRISVSDSGSGIAEEDLNRIFTPYFTTKQTGDESRGFGLGLAICRKIVHLHGGSLKVTSRKNRGTTVHVDLPTTQVNEQNSLAKGA